jgi:hypothetical protein
LTCEYVGRCGKIIAIDCVAAVDGLFYYVDATNSEILEYCGDIVWCPITDFAKIVLHRSGIASN